MNTNKLNICLEWWGGTNRDLHWDGFVCCRNWICLFPGLSLQSISSWWQKMSFVKGTPLPKSIFQQMFFVSCCESSEWQPTREKDKKKRQEYNILDVIFQKLLTQNVLHESSISKCACIKEIVQQQRYLYQNLTESHLNIKWQKTCLMSGMKNGWHLFMIFSFNWTLSSPQITQRNFTIR